MTTPFLNWFEIPVLEFYRAKAFYEYVFQTELTISALGAYTMGFFPTGSGPSGSIVQGEGYQPSVFGPRLYLNCNPDLQVFVDRALEAGGKLVVPKMLITEEVGYVSFILDCEGNALAFHSLS
ncbi:MAG TPA: VOC family protein [Catalimonadaceae bacterium]|jgi:predicted enzyme related to lactoylglutathione lyase|nr:VOC family protein [Catalimonadaceae bacterium]HPI11956.1 VOC family protein [Catalimonadaceae bacterium]